MEIFVNEAITNGINIYLGNYSDQNFLLSHYFEYKVIELLARVYGKINITNPYQIHSEFKFRDNLMIYGAKKEDIVSLISLLDDYNSWLKSVSRDKNDIVENIFYILSKLVILKERSVGLLEEDREYYDNFFSLKDNRIDFIVKISGDKDRVLEAFKKGEDDINNAPKEEEVKYLTEDEYEKYGIFFNEVKSLSKDKLKRLNNEIISREESNSANSGGTQKTSPLQYVLTSGNGFVDALVLLSIMCTELMVGIIITVLIGG
jgi:hypothetical protein